MTRCVSQGIIKTLFKRDIMNHIVIHDILILILFVANLLEYMCGKFIKIELLYRRLKWLFSR